MTAGIYALYWAKSDMIYVGKSVDIPTRFRDHCNKLKANTHTNHKMLAEFTKYGLPILSVIESVEASLEQDMYAKEILWINEFDSFNTGCNLTKGGDSGPIYKGAEHPNSRATEQQLLDAFTSLCDNILTQKEISIKYSISVGIIERIAQGTGHKWLQERFPDKYTYLLSINRDFRKSQSKNFVRSTSKAYPALLSPEGIIYSDIPNLTQFAKEHNLQAGNLHKLFNGYRVSHKGWHLAKKI